MSTKNAKKAKLTGNGGPPDGPIGHWTQRITRERPALLSRKVRCYFVVKNHGPDGAQVEAEHGDRYDLPPGTVRAMYAYGAIHVRVSGESALIEFDFLPYFK